MRRTNLPTKEEIEAARWALEAEDEAAARARHTPTHDAIVAENARRTALPSEHPDHIHGMMCDGQDGQNSWCVRLREKLFGKDT